MAFSKRLASALGAAVLGVAAWSHAAMAAEPVDWGLGFQPSASPVMDRIESFHDMLMVIITLITIFVLALLVYVMWRFRESANPNPSKTTHNTLIEILWTVVPVLILVVIAIPSFRLLYYQDLSSDADMTIKAIGKQWYWTYEYPDHGNFAFDAILVADEDLEEGEKRLLETDNLVVLPVDTTIRIQVTASDVLHSFAVPAFGIKTDAVPGRLNETWVEIPAEHAGTTFYGQCSELCGTGHAYMPIAIKAVSKDAFESWVSQAKEEFARLEAPAEREEVQDAPRLAQAATAQQQ